MKRWPTLICLLVALTLAFTIPVFAGQAISANVTANDVFYAVSPSSATFVSGTLYNEDTTFPVNNVADLNSFVYDCYAQFVPLGHSTSPPAFTGTFTLAQEVQALVRIPTI
jgi:hypothetical protein